MQKRVCDLQSSLMSKSLPIGHLDLSQGGLISWTPLVVIAQAKKVFGSHASHAQVSIDVNK